MINSSLVPAESYETSPEFKNFSVNLIQVLKDIFPKNVRLEFTTVKEDHSVDYSAILVRREAGKFSYIFYLADLYNSYCEGKSYEDIGRQILEKNQKRDDFEVDKIGDYEWVKKHLIFQLVNFEKNKDIFEDALYIKILDLAVEVRVDTKDIIHKDSSMLIQNHHMKEWNISRERLIRDAAKNMFRSNMAELKSISEIMKKERDADSKCEQEMELDIYVLTNTTKNYGAIMFFSSKVREYCAKRLGNRFYILPSSVHELILIPEDSMGDTTKMIHAVRELNKTDISPMEVLSDQLYKYDHDLEVLDMLDIKNSDNGEESAFVSMNVHSKDMNLCNFGISESMEDIVESLLKDIADGL